MEVRDEFIDHSKRISWENIDMCLESVDSSIMFICSHKCSLSTPVIRDMSYTIPERTNILRKIHLLFRKKTPPEKWKTLEGAADSRSYGKHFLAREFP